MIDVAKYYDDPARTQAYIDIMHTMSIYQIGIDEGDFEMVGSAFAEDAIVQLSNGMQVSGRTAICEAFRQRLENRLRNVMREAVFQRHNLTTRLIDIMQDETARSTSYFTVFTEIGLDHLGRYFDQFSIRDGRWLFSFRKIELDWMHETSRFRANRSP